MDLQSIHALEVLDIRRHHRAMMLKSTSRYLHIRLTDNNPS